MVERRDKNIGRKELAENERGHMKDKWGGGRKEGRERCRRREGGGREVVSSEHAFLILIIPSCFLNIDSNRFPKNKTRKSDSFFLLSTELST